MPNNESDVKYRTIDLGAEARRLWGKRWGAPETAYEFGGRKFQLRTEDGAAYNVNGSVGTPIQKEGITYSVLAAGAPGETFNLVLENRSGRLLRE